MEQIIKDTTANPAPLGLFGFGMTTILLNIHNAGFYELNSMIMAMGLFIGGAQQDWKPSARPSPRRAAGKSPLRPSS